MFGSQPNRGQSFVVRGAADQLEALREKQVRKERERALAFRAAQAAPPPAPRPTAHKGRPPPAPPVVVTPPPPRQAARKGRPRPNLPVRHSGWVAYHNNDTNGWKAFWEPNSQPPEEEGLPAGTGANPDAVADHVEEEPASPPPDEVSDDDEDRIRHVSLEEGREHFLDTLELISPNGQIAPNLRRKVTEAFEDAAVLRDDDVVLDLENIEEAFGRLGDDHTMRANTHQLLRNMILRREALKQEGQRDGVLSLAKLLEKQFARTLPRDEAEPPTSTPPEEEVDVMRDYAEARETQVRLAEISMEDDLTFINGERPLAPSLKKRIYEAYTDTLKLDDEDFEDALDDLNEVKDAFSYLDGDPTEYKKVHEKLQALIARRKAVRNDRTVKFAELVDAQFTKRLPPTPAPVPAPVPVASPAVARVKAKPRRNLPPHMSKLVKLMRRR